MHNLRLTDQLVGYWNALREDHPVPDFARFSASAVGDGWPQCILFTLQPAVAEATPGMNFYAMGARAAAVVGGADLVGKPYRPAASHFQGAAIIQRIGEMLPNPAPLLDSGHFAGEGGKIVKFRSCILPFARGDVVTHVLAGLSWGEF